MDWDRFDWKPNGHKVYHNYSKKLKYDELQFGSHLQHHNHVYTDSKRLRWELGHQVEHNPFKKWEKNEWKLGGHQVAHNLFKEWKRNESKPIITHNIIILIQI